jgi:lipopolysaccharide transport system ATP-binding protein
MGNLALKVEGLGKQYRIGKQERYRTFRDTLVDVVTAPARRAIGLLRGNAAAAANLTETIWALRDVSFEVKHGEVVGIIGRNGAGKSTLLKILSRITEPTTGYADVYGRVGALLEVGTGFHPELTGRENIYLNGAILGMSREEIRRKFDEIVDFAGVEKFIDTPVKHYSSGMGLRLGFAVAAHLEPEILVVDEVLAVGDAEFQKKCMGKMSQVAGEGRTVLFVSHNMAAVQNMCTRGVVLQQGKVIFIGDVDQAIKRYISELSNKNSKISLKERNDRRGNGALRFTQFHLEDNDCNVVEQIISGNPIKFIIDYESKNPVEIERVAVGITISDLAGQNIVTLFSGYSGDQFVGLSTQGQFECQVDSFPLAAGSYKITLWSGIDGAEVFDWITDATTIDVLSSDFYSTGRVPNIQIHGPLLLKHSWENR